MVVPSLETFLELSQQNRPIVVARKLLADLETPLSCYWKLSHNSDYSFLLESVSGGENLARYSYIGFDPRSVIQGSAELGADPLQAVQKQMQDDPIVPEGLPKFIGGAVGFIAYDYVRYLEELPNTTEDDLKIPDVAMMISDQVVAFDHARNEILILKVTQPTADSYAKAVETFEEIANVLASPMPAIPAEKFSAPESTGNMTQAEYETKVLRMKEFIEAGDAFQLVPSQRFSVPNQAHPVSLYRCLRSINPSPYMFLLHFPEMDLVGASPEVLVGLAGRSARVRPIAGTRWRGKTEEEDNALAEQLLADEKERAEHVMLVDLGRNDIGRIAEYGSVKVSELMTIERYSHVMHIVSNVTGDLREDLDQFDLFRATFPAGTVTGAPKIRAMQIIDELEPTRRGTYAGATGYFGFNGDMDMAITLRTILVKNGYAYVQAGGGVVFDSDPTFEYNESRNKAGAPLRAIELAHTGELFS